MGQSIGPIVDVDAASPSFLLRVSFDMTKPLRRVLYADYRREEKDFVLQYEKLPNFCFIFGKVDHID